MNKVIETGVDIRVGDICYIDFGETRLYEVGYQHMGLVLSIMNRKIFVVPFTGNQLKFVEAQSIDNPIGKSLLIQIPKLKGLTKKSVAIINDAKWINSARVIDVKSHLHPESDLFQFIKQNYRAINLISGILLILIGVMMATGTMGRLLGLLG